MLSEREKSVAQVVSGRISIRPFGRFTKAFSLDPPIIIIAGFSDEPRMFMVG